MVFPSRSFVKRETTHSPRGELRFDSTTLDLIETEFTVAEGLQWLSKGKKKRKKNLWGEANLPRVFRSSPLPCLEITPGFCGKHADQRMKAPSVPHSWIFFKRPSKLKKTPQKNIHIQNHYSFLVFWCCAVRRCLVFGGASKCHNKPSSSKLPFGYR